MVNGIIMPTDRVRPIIPQHFICLTVLGKVPLLVMMLVRVNIINFEITSQKAEILMIRYPLLTTYFLPTTAMIESTELLLISDLEACPSASPFFLIASHTQCFSFIDRPHESNFIRNLHWLVSVMTN